MAKVILLAEDSPDDEALFKFVMHKAGVENPVVVVRDGRETISYLNGEGEYADRSRFPRAEILFLDLKMPHVDGFAVLEWLRTQPELRNGLLVIVLSHFGDANGIRRAYEMGANSFFPKPFTGEDWVNLIEAFAPYWLRPAQADSRLAGHHVNGGRMLQGAPRKSSSGQ